jgi:hypothetical protein
VTEHIGISVGAFIFDLIFGFLLGLFVFAWLLSLRVTESLALKPAHLRGVDPLITTAFIGVINVVFLAYVLIQFTYLFASRESLPNGISITEYARSGFFELCWIIGIAALLIALTMILTRKSEDGSLPVSTRVSVSMLILCLFVSVVSAFYRMYHYVQAYDLTVKRLSVLWLILVIALGLAGAVVRIWLKDFKYMAYIAGVVILMTVGLNCLNTNKFIAHYNVNRYIYNVDHDIEPTLTSGVSAKELLKLLGDLGPSAAEDTARLIEQKGMDEKEVKATLTRQAVAAGKKTWRNATVASIRSKKVFEKHNIIVPEFNKYDY